MTTFKGRKRKIYTNQEQIAHTKQEVGNQRFIWKHFLDLNIKYHKKTGEFIFYTEMCSMLPKIKEKFPFLKLGYSQSLQQTLKDLDQALKNCFKSGFGFPKFKRYNQNDSYRVPQNFKLEGNKIFIPKLGKVRIGGKNKLKKNEIVKHVTISREVDGWYISLCIEFKPKKLPKTGRKVGLDVGSVRTYTRSDGKHRRAFRDLPNVIYLVRKIKRIQRQMAWKQECWKERTGRKKLKKGEVISQSWLKLKHELQKLHQHLRNIRQDWLHKTSFFLVKRYDKIVVEDLRLKNMTKSSKGTTNKPGKNVAAKSGLNRNLLDNGLGTLVSLLEYKCRWYGKELVKVRPHFTSHTCSKCGYKHKENRHGSEFKCLKCGLEMNADKNAAKNILALAA